MTVFTLLCEGKPLKYDELLDGDNVTYNVATCEVISIEDKDGNVVWKLDKPMAGQVGHMRAVRK